MCIYCNDDTDLRDVLAEVRNGHSENAKCSNAYFTEPSEIIRLQPAPECDVGHK